MSEDKYYRRNISKVFDLEQDMKLPVVGIFWDIENCSVPKGKSAFSLAQRIREKFTKESREAEYLCVCDINKEAKSVIDELNQAQVTIIHVDATCKNAADDKLRQCMRRFADTHSNSATIILITSDVNFSGDLSDCRHRKGFQIILIHCVDAPQSLIACSHEHYSFTSFTSQLPDRQTLKLPDKTKLKLIVSNLPSQKNPKHILSRLKRLADNCGGKVGVILQTNAVIAFSTYDSATRAQKRMDGQNVLGSLISVKFPPKKKEKFAPDSTDSASSIATVQSNSGNLKNIDSSNKMESKKSPKHEGFGIFKGPPPDLIRREFSSKQAISFPARGDEKCITSQENTSRDFSEKVDTHSRKPTTYSNNIWRSTPIPHEDHPHPSQAYHPISLHYGQRVSMHINNDMNFNRHNGSPQKFNPIPYPYDTRSNNIRHEPAHHNIAKSGYTAYNKRYVNLEHLSQENINPKGNISYGSNCGDNQCVELRVTNLDQNLDVQQLKKLLFSVFNEHIMVLHVSISILVDGNYVATIKVPSMQDAQFAISQLHRRKIGFKRILISLNNEQNVVPIHILRGEVASLVQEIPNRKLPLFKFRELFEKRYHRSVSIADLCKIKDTLIIDEDGPGRMISLNPDYRNISSPADSTTSETSNSASDKRICELHYKPDSKVRRGWAEQDCEINLPDVSISLKLLATRVHTLLHTHDGLLPLSTIEWCYRSEFGSFESPTCNKDTDSYSGVPLEHLISCIPGIEIVTTPAGFKKINWAENKNLDPKPNNPSASTSVLATQLVLFGREIVDLLKNSPRCQISFNKFIPAYHHHFGRQCRVADYGYTKLADLMAALSHVVHVIGDNPKRLLTLTHRSQVKRFTADLLRVLKSQPNKQMMFSDLPAAYLKCIGKNFNMVDYGVCSLSDMISEVPDGIVVVNELDNQAQVSIPRRDQTAEEIDKTKQFSTEVVELLKYSPQCSMDFNKFIPAYHHHYGKQCKVSDYGFTKLIELFEAIPDIVEIQGESDDKFLHLTECEVLKVLAEHIVSLIKLNQKQQRQLFLNDLPSAFVNLYGYSLKPDNFQAESLEQLLDKIRHAVKIIETASGPILVLVDKSFVKEISAKVRRILMEEPDAKMEVKYFVKKYKKMYRDEVNMSIVKNELHGICTVEDSIVKLAPLQVFSRNVLVLLRSHNDRILLNKFDGLYVAKFKVQCCPEQYGRSNITTLLQSIPEVVLRGKGPKKTVALNKEVAGSPLTLKSVRCQAQLSGVDLIQVRNNSPVDILAQPVPSTVPSPDLSPHHNSTEPRDLIRFETPFNSELLIEDNRSDSQVLKTPPLLPPDSFSNVAEPTDEVMKALLNGTLPHLSPSDFHNGLNFSAMSSPQRTPPPSMLPHPSFLLSNSDTAKNVNYNQHYSYDDLISCDSSIENMSRKVLPSSHSTPTRNFDKSNKSRIAATFSLPLN